MPGDFDKVIVGSGPRRLAAVTLNPARRRILMTEDGRTHGDDGPSRPRAERAGAADVPLPRMRETEP